MKSVLLTLTILLASQVAMADRFYDCVCSRGCSGSELFDVDVLSNGSIKALLASEDYEVSERVDYRLDKNYTPRTRLQFVRYNPHSRTGNMYKYLPVILVEKALLIGTKSKSGKYDGTIYAQWNINGEFSETIYRCDRTKDRHITD